MNEIIDSRIRKEFNFSGSGIFLLEIFFFTGRAVSGELLKIENFYIRHKHQESKKEQTIAQTEITTFRYKNIIVQYATKQNKKLENSI